MTTSARPNLLQCLINAAEKASNIARACRSNQQLLELLVQEKIGDAANKRFQHDFKTLADVLIQETIKHDVGALFPEMRDAIRGEESPNFTNQLGESVSVVVGETPSHTAAVLSKVLSGYADAAEVLATEVHRNVCYTSPQLCDLPEMPVELDYSKLGVWIDPIDATAEYISGDSVFTNFPGITSSGLDCVTVLIGAYDRKSGLPVIGVVSQPFHNKISDKNYESQLFWGVALPELQANNCQVSQVVPPKRTAIFSSSENADLLKQVQQLGYNFVFSAGAGHKALKVITQEVNVYVLSKGTTFKWDTCAPQAILRSMGGDMVDFAESIKKARPIAVNYLENCTGDANTEVCNSGGLIAFRDANTIAELIEKLQPAT